MEDMSATRRTGSQSMDVVEYKAKYKVYSVRFQSSLGYRLDLAINFVRTEHIEEKGIIKCRV
jgi:hypothetical protein